MIVYRRGFPDVGKRREVDLSDGSRFIIVAHNNGKRKVFRRAGADGDFEKLFELADKLARQMGTLLESAHFQPVQTETIETLLDDNALIEWVEVDVSSDTTGKMLGESNFRQAAGTSVVAIKWDDEVVTSPGGDVMAEASDTPVVIGLKIACRDFVALVKGA